LLRERFARAVALRKAFLKNYFNFSKIIMESIISTFHIDWKIIIAQAINFGVVFVVLYIFALKPLGKLMAERSEKIAKGITDAKDNAALLEKARVEYDGMLSKARAQANEIFQEGKKEAENKKAVMLEEAKNEVAVVIENGKKTLEGEKIKMVEEAKKEIVTLAIQAAEKLLGVKADGSFDEKAVKELNNL
jgi:F-type H+-transporting ATPase subunit b